MLQVYAAVILAVFGLAVLVLLLLLIGSEVGQYMAARTAMRRISSRTSRANLGVSRTVSQSDEVNVVRAA